MQQRQSPRIAVTTMTVMTRLMLAAAVGVAGWFVAISAVPGQDAGAATTLTGVDVSRWDHPNGADIDWPKVKAAGRSFAIVKASEGTGYVNPYFATDYPQAKAAGLVVGAYHFAQPRLPISSAADQARHYVRTVGSFKGTGILPPVLDLECDGGGSPCTYGTDLTPTQLQQWTKLWLDTAQQMTGRVPIIYTYDSFWRNAVGNSTAFTKYPLWYARYTSTTPTAATLPGGWSRWTMWQYTSTGTTPGIPDTGDINRFNGDLSSLRALADGSRALGVPTAPLKVRASAAGAGWVKALWDTPTANGGAPITGYEVSVDGGAWVSAPRRAFIATGLAAGTRSIAVRALNIAGAGPATSLAVPVVATGTAPPSTTVAMSFAMPSTAPAGSLPVSVRVARTDTGQALNGSAIKLTQTNELGPSPSPLTLPTGPDGALWRTLSASVDATVTARFPGSPGIAAKASARSVRVTPWVAASFNDASVPRGTKVRLSARTTYLLKGALIHRQYYSRGAWRTVASTRIAADGRASFLVPVSYSGTRSYRVLIPSTSAHSWAKSSTLPLRGW